MFDHLCDSALTVHLVELDRQRGRLDAEILAVTAAWDARQVWAADGAVTGPAWLAANTQVSRQRAGEQVRVGRRLRDMPLVAEAAAAGELGPEKIRALARVAGGRTAKAFERDEIKLVVAAKELRVDHLRRFLRAWEHEVDPDGAELSASEQRDARKFHMSQLAFGMWRIDGELDAEAGALLKAAIDSITDAMFRAESADDADRPTPEQRRADALAELARQYNESAGEASTSPSRPACTVVIRLPDLSADIDGEPITPEAARRLACEAGISRIVTDAQGAVLDAGTTTRVPNPTQRRALHIRDRGCTFPGCDRPPAWCHAHHLRHWIDGGPTNLDNLTLLCSRHHHLVHEGRFHLARGPDGNIRATRPDGTPIHTSYHRHPA